MPENITQIKLKFSCGENWDAMNSVENGGRHCNQCHKVVYDFTNSKADEFRKILAENNYNVCGRFAPEQMAPKSFPFWKRWVSAAMLLIGINLFSNKADAQKNHTQKSASQNTNNQPDSSAILGIFIEQTAEFPGGMERFQQYLARNLQHTSNPFDKVTVSFVIERDGSLTDIKIINGLNYAINQNVLRTLSLSPKWKPKIYNGRLEQQTITLPVQIGNIKMIDFK